MRATTSHPRKAVTSAILSRPYLIPMVHAFLWSGNLGASVFSLWHISGKDFFEMIFNKKLKSSLFEKICWFCLCVPCFYVVFCGLWCYFSFILNARCSVWTRGTPLCHPP